MERIKNLSNKINRVFIEKKFYIYGFIFFFALINSNIAFANDLLNNPITEGLKKMLQDGLKLLMILSTLAAPVFIAFYQFKKKISDDEMEGKQYDKKTKAVIVCYVLIMTASIIISIVSGYFKISASV